MAVIRPEDIPRTYWREVPCGHPPDPVAVVTEDGAICHCGWLLDQRITSFDVPGAPGPVRTCERCGCHVACPEDES
jgi:hypothetical protein